MVALNSCVGMCNGKFDPNGSTTYALGDGIEYMMFFSDSNAVSVVDARDTVCLGLDESTCVKDFWFKTVRYATDM